MRGDVLFVLSSGKVVAGTAAVGAVLCDGGIGLFEHTAGDGVGGVYVCGAFAAADGEGEFSVGEPGSMLGIRKLCNQGFVCDRGAEQRIFRWIEEVLPMLSFYGFKITPA